ncbi:NAD-dependent glutamate dehydrogenase [Mycoemilia scoparia]|uniref:NAD-specific glutamate dehydrogenase n=1 Tax=Mycoemilia scoparia TaxID=417184 RepID=A0A9W7ZXX2_9FUNG|nr:NAD-dependent glutamate dehydrogenase [Mycoemilia scoparia]
MTASALLNNDYSDNVYSGKANHLKETTNLLHGDEYSFIPREKIDKEVNWFYNDLGLDDYYFMTESPETVANHILAIYGSKIMNASKQHDKLTVNLAQKSEQGAVYIHNSQPGISKTEGPHYESIIDKEFLDVSTPELAYRMESFRSRGTVYDKTQSTLRAYFVSKCNFPESKDSDNADAAANSTTASSDSVDINAISDVTFLAKATDSIKQLYSNLIAKVLSRTGPVIHLDDIPTSGEHRLVVAYRQRSTQSYLSALSDLYHYYSFFSSRKYVEQFSNGVTIICLYLNPLNPNDSEAKVSHTIKQITREASLLYCLPTTPFQTLYKQHKISVQEMIYGHVGWVFVQHFVNRLGSEYASLTRLLSNEDPSHLEVLGNIKKRLRQETFTREYLLEIITQHTKILKLLYLDFASIHYSGSDLGSPKSNGTFAGQGSEVDTAPGTPLAEDDLRDIIKRETTTSHEALVLESFLLFNKHVLKTNFYQPTKVALSFRLNANFLPDIEFPTKPYGLFFVIGNEFRGFHVRFMDVARGGIRIIRSRNQENYLSNMRTLFDENYSLASTQQRKNKDIPEGGSKGTVLLNLDSQDKPFVAFEKYVDSILDLLLDGQTPGIKEKLVDLYGKEEILFFGPDEGTANYMDWASQHARRRGANFWKAFTTGKSQTMGGIPHDTYGMTTRSVHQYVLGILRKLGLNEEDCTKLQTGGPDGDLGSNEIKISKDKTIAVVDGSGVLVDPKGIDRVELGRLANARQMISHFDTSKLTPQGFRVLVDDYQVTLPDGTIVADGLSFRNLFHLNSRASADFFVPCGGRPESIDINNVSRIISEDGIPNFKYVVEGANLFFTQDARLKLEKLGVHLFKDASANKGGVTSSSLEVLAALALSDEEHGQLMCEQPDGSLPEFYKEYVKNVQDSIERNARLEFECLWRESERTNKPKSVLSDDLSFAIIKLREELEQTSMWSNIPLRRLIMSKALPKLLLDKLGLDKILERVPENYLKAIFGAFLASNFVYQYGTEPSQFAFFDYMSPFFSELGQN